MKNKKSSKQKPVTEPNAFDFNNAEDVFDTTVFNGKTIQSFEPDRKNADAYIIKFTDGTVIRLSGTYNECVMILMQKTK